METYVVHAPGGLDRLEIVERDDPGEPGPGEVRVAIHATSLNFHDLLVANGGIPTEDGRVLMADGAGVEAVGAGVAEFAPGDHVVSTFFPHWIAGRSFTAVGNFAGTPGDGIDGMAATHVVRPVSAFTRAPKGWSHPEAATITTSGLIAWRALVIDGALQACQTMLTLGSGGVSLAALQLVKAMGCACSSDLLLRRKCERLPGSGGGALDAD